MVLPATVFCNATFAQAQSAGARLWISADLGALLKTRTTGHLCAFSAHDGCTQAGRPGPRRPGGLALASARLRHSAGEPSLITRGYAVISGPEWFEEERSLRDLWASSFQSGPHFSRCRRWRAAAIESSPTTGRCSSTVRGLGWRTRRCSAPCSRCGGGRAGNGGGGLLQERALCLGEGTQPSSTVPG